MCHLQNCRGMPAPLRRGSASV